MRKIDQFLLIDIDNNIIVDVEATPTNRVLEVESSQHMLEQVEKKYAIKPKRLMADTAYGSGEMLDWMVKEKAIEPHIPENALLPIKQPEKDSTKYL